MTRIIHVWPAHVKHTLTSGSENVLRSPGITTGAEDADALFHAELTKQARGRFSVRHATHADRPFLQRLFVQTQVEAVQRAGADADPLARGPLLDMQFQAQAAAYAAAYPRARHYIGARTGDGIPVGRLLVDWMTGSDEPVLGIDVAVLPSARSGALGLHFLRAMVATCDRLQRAARLHVMPDNPARLIYRRIGFVAVDATAFPIPMLRSPSLTQRGLDRTT